MQDLLRTHGIAAQDPQGLVDGAVRALAALCSRDPATHSALDLLAIDGLITAAFAALPDDADSDALAGAAAARLLALGDPSNPAA